MAIAEEKRLLPRDLCSNSRAELFHWRAGQPVRNQGRVKKLFTSVETRYTRDRPQGPVDLLLNNLKAARRGNVVCQRMRIGVRLVGEWWHGINVISAFYKRWIWSSS